MKKITLMLAIAIMSISFAAEAQQQRQQVPIEERVAKTVEKLTTDLSLDEKQSKALAPIYTTYYQSMADLRKNGERPTPESMTALTTTRNESLKKVLTADQMKKLEEQEAEMRKNRPAQRQQN